jgi:hypothetical protein
VPLEIVRLPVPEGTEGAVVAYLDGNPYFAQEGLVAHRLLVAEDAPEVTLLLDWTTRAAAGPALRSAVGQAFLEGLTPLLAGAPQTAFYAEPDQ